MNFDNLFQQLAERVAEVAAQKTAEKIKAEFDLTKSEPTLPELLTRKQAAEFLGICIATLDNWVNAGKIHKHRNGNSVRFKRSELLRDFQSIEKYQRA